MSAPGSRSSYANGSVGNLVRSLLVVGGLVALLIAVVPRVNQVSQPPVDVAGTAAQVAADTGWPISVASGLPDGWKATSVRYVRSTDGVMTWHAGYQAPSGNYVALEQTREATDGWVEAQTNRARRTGQLQAAGLGWDTYVRSGKVQNSLVHRAQGSAELTTIVTGTGTFEELTAFAEALTPASSP